MDKNFYSPTMLVNYVNLKHFITDEFGDEIFKLESGNKEKSIKSAKLLL